MKEIYFEEAAVFFFLPGTLVYFKFLIWNIFNTQS